MEKEKQEAMDQYAEAFPQNNNPVKDDGDDDEEGEE